MLLYPLVAGYLYISDNNICTQLAICIFYKLVTRSKYFDIV